MPTFFGVLAGGANCTNSADVLSKEIVPNQGMLSTAGRWRSSMVTSLFFFCCNRVALSILDASFKFARASHLVSGQPWLTVRIEQTAFGGILCLLRSDWSLRSCDVCAASEKGFPFAVREGCRQLSSEIGRVSERMRFWRSSRSVRARSRALRTPAPEAVSECSISGKDEVSRARRESR